MAGRVFLGAGGRISSMWTARSTRGPVSTPLASWQWRVRKGRGGEGGGGGHGRPEERGDGKHNAAHGGRVEMELVRCRHERLREQQSAHGEAKREQIEGGSELEDLGWVMACKFWSSQLQLIAGWCNKHATRYFSTKNKAISGRVYQKKELEPTTPVKDNDIIIDRIQKSTRELKQGPTGKNLSSAEKRKFLINTLLVLEDSKEVVYSTLDAWVAFEQEFPLASLKQALSALEKEEKWHRIIQVIKWMLSKGQGKTMRTYELLVCALENDNRAEEAHRMWQKKAAHDLRSVPWRFCHLMFGIYYRNNELDRLVKLFKDLEACARIPTSKDIIRKVEDAYEMLGQLEEKKALLDKYKELYNMPSRNDQKKSSKLKKTEMNKTTADGSSQSMMETSEALADHSCTSDKEPVVA